MNKYVLLLLVISLFSCQKEELTIVEEQEDNSFLSDEQLTDLMKSVVFHDGSFDDLIDQSPCFSINFPYQILLNGETYNISTINDLLVIDAEDVVEPIFPLTITFATYVENEVTTSGVFENLISGCNNWLLSNFIITCVDFTYPIRISIFNTENSEYETVVFNNDEDAFMGISLFDSTTLATIHYPIEVQLIDGTQIVIESNDQLKARILQMLPVCQ